jgi:hypothetical protein
MLLTIEPSHSSGAVTFNDVQNGKLSGIFTEIDLRKHFTPPE